MSFLEPVSTPGGLLLAYVWLRSGAAYNLVLYRSFILKLLPKHSNKRNVFPGNVSREGKNPMDRLIAAANIQYFRERLAGAVDQREIKDLRFLIAREECRLRDISSSKEQITTRH